MIGAEQPGQTALAFGLLSFLAVVGAVIYGRLFTRLVRTGGQVRVAALDWPELIVAGLLFGWLGLLAEQGFRAEPRPVNESSLIQGASVFPVIVLGILLLLKYRRHRLRELFGFDRVSFTTLLGCASGWLLAAFPLIAGMNLAVQHLLPPGKHAQEIVQFFLEANQRGDWRSVVEIIVLGVVVAPLCEEFIFRGFLYGTAKRYLGVIPAMVLVAFLFGAVHLNLSALPGLMLLAMCFTIAYETTGSLFTSMLMHAFFNATSFALMMLAPKLMV